MQTENKLGHNKPPKSVEELINDQGRIKLSNSIIRKLKRKVDDKGNYIETIYNDTERVGLKLKVNKGGSITFFYQWYNKNKQRRDGKKGATDKQFIGQFPEWKIEAARQLVDKIKQGIKLGTDPRSTFEANKAIPTLAEVIALWKEDVLKVSNTFRESTKKDLLARFRVWIDLNPKSKALQDYVLKNRKLLNIKAAGYGKKGSYARASELLDYKKNPSVVLEIQQRLAALRQQWDIDRDKHLAMLTKIRDEARIKGQYGVVAKCEELRGKVGGLYIEKSMVLSKDIKDDTSNEALRKVWGSREDFEKSMLIMAEDMYPDQKSSLYDDSNIEITEEELEARERGK